MGDTTSKNEINSTINAMMEESANVTFDLNSNCNVSNLINLKDCTFKGGSVNMTQEGTCLLNTKGKSDVDIQQLSNQEITQMLSQKASTVAQNLNLDPGTASSENITNTLIDTSQQTSSNIASKCTSSTNTSNTLNCNDSIFDGTKFAVNQKTAVQNLLDCAQKSKISQTQSNLISQSIQQTAKTERKNAIAAVLFAIAAILAAAALLLFAGGSDMMIIIAVVVVIVAIVGLFAYLKSLKSKQPDNDYVAWEENCKRPGDTSDIGYFWCADCSQYSVTDQDKIKAINNCKPTDKDCLACTDRDNVSQWKPDPPPKKVDQLKGKDPPPIRHKCYIGTPCELAACKFDMNTGVCGPGSPKNKQCLQYLDQDNCEYNFCKWIDGDGDTKGKCVGASGGCTFDSTRCTRSNYDKYIKNLD